MVSSPRISSAFFTFNNLHLFNEKKYTHVITVVHTEIAAQPNNYIPNIEPLSKLPQRIPFSGKKNTEANIAVKLAVPNV